MIPRPTKANNQNTNIKIFTNLTPVITIPIEIVIDRKAQSRNMLQWPIYKWHSIIIWNFRSGKWVCLFHRQLVPENFHVNKSFTMCVLSQAQTIREQTNIKGMFSWETESFLCKELGYLFNTNQTLFLLQKLKQLCKYICFILVFLVQTLKSNCASSIHKDIWYIPIKRCRTSSSDNETW